MAVSLIPPRESTDESRTVVGAALELVVSLVSSTVVTAEVGQSSVSFVASSMGTDKDLFGFDPEVEIVEVRSGLDKCLILWPKFWVVG
jgi:hypothetical protein